MIKDNLLEKIHKGSSHCLRISTSEKQADTYQLRSKVAQKHFARLNNHVTTSSLLTSSLRIQSRRPSVSFHQSPCTHRFRVLLHFLRVMPVDKQVYHWTTRSPLIQYSIASISTRHVYYDTKMELCCCSNIVQMWETHEGLAG